MKNRFRAFAFRSSLYRPLHAGINLGDAEKVFKMDENDRDKDVVHQMEQCPFPIIGAINGFAINAGRVGTPGCRLVSYMDHT